VWPYREDDELGGHEPYGLSKAMAEMAIAQYGATYFAASASPGAVKPRLISVRAGNVIGGGDWSEDRLVPDAVRAWQKEQALIIRSPDATRPWQHVLDVVNGLLLLAEHALGSRGIRSTAYNIGPDWAHSVSVAALVELLRQNWGQGADFRVEAPQWRAPEAHALSVDSTRFRSELDWRPFLPLSEAVLWTVEWYKAYLADAHAARSLTAEQIKRFLDAPF
jgi:CDP-glucose 4,6-dehydratase